MRRIISLTSRVLRGYHFCDQTALRPRGDRQPRFFLEERHLADLYGAPAGVDDFSLSVLHSGFLRRAWDQKIRAMVTAEAGNLYYGVLEDASGVLDGGPVMIPWDAFPRSLSVWFDAIETDDPEGRAERAADTLRPRRYWKLAGREFRPFVVRYRQQDEYCEWRTWADESGPLRMAFSCENPEYWATIAETDPVLLVRLYRQTLRTDDVQAEDLFWPHDVFLPGGDGADPAFAVVFKAGEYNPYNVWNTDRGLVHLTHPSNSLAAEVHLAAQGSWRYPGDEALDARGLLCCGGHGRVERSSDPTIASTVSGYARKGFSVALADPIGLYIQPPRFELRTPDGRDVSGECIRVARGDAGRNMILRLEIEAPPGAGYALSQLRLPGNSPLSASRVARLLGMGLFAHAKSIPGAEPLRIVGCTCFCCADPGVPAYRATFPNDDHDHSTPCDQLSADAWAAHVPVEPPTPGGHATLAGASQAPDAVRRPTRSVF